MLHSVRYTVSNKTRWRAIGKDAGVSALHKHAHVSTGAHTWLCTCEYEHIEGKLVISLQRPGEGSKRKEEFIFLAHSLVGTVLHGR